MSYQHPLNIKVKESYYVENTRHCPVLTFRYTKNGTEKDIGYLFGYYDQKKAAEDYTRLKEIQIDASAVTDKESAQTFYDETLSAYPVPADVDKHLSEFEALKEEKAHHWALEATLHNALNNIVIYQGKPEDAAEMHGFMKELLEHVAQGKKIEDFQIKGAVRYEWGIGSSRNINLYHRKKRAKMELGNLDGIPADWPQKTVITPEIAQKILSQWPETPYSDRKACDTLISQIAYDGKENEFNRKFHHAVDTIMRDLVAIRSREIMSVRIERTVKQQMQKLEKAERTKQKAEQIKKHRDEVRTKNAAEGQKKKEAAQKKVAARQRLIDKGLVSADPNNGTAHHWGTSPNVESR